MPRLFVHVFSGSVHMERTVTSPIVGSNPLFWFFPDRADDGVRTRGFLLGKQACYHCTTSAWPCFFSDTSHGGDVLSTSRKRGGWLPSERPGLARRMGLGYLRSPTLFDPFLPVVTDVLIPPAGAAGRTARASSRPGEIHGKRYSHASRIDRIRTCDPMLPKHVRYQTAPQSDIFDRTPWLTSYVRALLNAISSDSGTVLSSTTMLSS